MTDGDHSHPNCLTLPGSLAPERVVFGDLKANNWINLPERFGIGAGSLFATLDDAMLDPDHHKWPTLVGDQVAKSGTSVWEILCTEWCRSCLDENARQEIATAITAVIH